MKEYKSRKFNTNVAEILKKKKKRQDYQRLQRIKGVIMTHMYSNFKSGEKQQLKMPELDQLTQ